MKKIDEVFDFLGFEKIGKNPGDDNESLDSGEFFYRGVSDKTYRIAPSVFRGNDDENALYHLIFRNHFAEFVGMKPVEILAKMQHFGIPTRLLDVTKSHLSVAFFAVSNLKKENPNAKDKSPEILKFNVPSEKLKDYDSDTVKLLSHLALLKESDKKQLRTEALNELLIAHWVDRYLSFSRQIYWEDRRGPFWKMRSKDILESIKRVLANMFREFLKPMFFQGFVTFNQEKTKKGYSFFDVNIGKLTNNPDIIDILKVYNYEIMSPSPKWYLKHLNVYYENDVIFHCELSENDGLFFLNNVETRRFENIKPLPDLYDASTIFHIEDDHYSDVMEKLHYQILQNHPAFFRCARSLDLLNGVFVTPIANTERMKSQHGLFMIFGLSRYWDVLKCIEFLSSKNWNFNEIIEFVIKDEPLKESTCIKKKYGKSNENSENFIREFENYVFDVERYGLKGDAKKATTIEKLNAMGINKATLGCGMDTTYYQYLLDKN